MQRQREIQFGRSQVSRTMLRRVHNICGQGAAMTLLDASLALFCDRRENMWH